MQTGPRKSLTAAVALSAALAPNAPAQPLHPRDSGAPRFLNIVRQTLRPGRGGAYHEILQVIARTYERLQVPAYWIELQSMTGQPAMLSLNLFDSFDEVERAVHGIGAATASDTELRRLQEELLTNISAEQTVLTVLRDDITGAAPAIGLAATMRLVRITTITAAPGHEAALADALRAACSDAESARQCLVYEADAGVSNPTFVLLTPLTSLADLGADITARHARPPTPANSGAGPGRSMPDLASAACSSATCTSVESEIYVVNPGLSHVPVAFKAADAVYWTPPAARPQAPR